MSAEIPNIKMVDLAGQYQKIKVEVNSAIQHVIDSAQFIKGPSVSSFENKLAEYLDVKHVISCANGTDALQVAMMALDLEEGDEIILPAFTYPATVEVVALLKLKPVLVDVDVDTFNISVDGIREAISDKTKVILPVHLYGQSAEMNSILEIAKQHKLKIIEDNAQALGTTMHLDSSKTVKTGTIGDIGTTSFFPTKNLGCYGDGGALFTNDDNLAQKIRMICNHGQEKKYYHKCIGVNSRLDTIQAAILEKKLIHLDEYIQTKKIIAKRYDTAFEQIENIVVPYNANYSTHTNHQYTIQVSRGNRDDLKEHLKSKGIPSVVYYPLPLHKQEAYKNIVKQSGSLINSEKMSQQVLSLPVHTELSSSQQDYIIDVVKNYFN